MTDLSYINAWSHWLKGENVSGYYLWTLQIVWWGRIGKVVSFISAFAIIADIVGAERLRVFGKSLHHRFTFQMVKKTIKDSLRALWMLVFILFAVNDRKEKNFVRDQYYRTKVGRISLVLSWAMGLYAFLFFYHDRALWRRLLYSFGVLIGVNALAGPLITISFIVLPMLVLLCVDLVLVEPFAWVLERQGVDKLIKVVSLTLLIVGFHFDLLAS